MGWQASSKVYDSNVPLSEIWIEIFNLDSEFGRVVNASKNLFFSQIFPCSKCFRFDEGNSLKLMPHKEFENQS